MKSTGCPFPGFILFAAMLCTYGMAAAQETAAPAADTAKKIIITDIIISGNRKTKNYIISREMTLKKGDTVLLSKLDAEAELSRRNVFNSTLFNEVAVVPVKMNDREYNIFVTVKERWYVIPLPQFRLIDRNFNEWWNNQNRDLSRTIYGVRFSHNNFSGRRDRLQLTLLNGYAQQVTLGYAQPFADRKLQHGFSFNTTWSRRKEVYNRTFANQQVFYKDTVRNIFLQQSLRFDGAYTYRRGIYDRHTVRLSWVDDRYDDSVLRYNPAFFGVSTARQRYPEFFYNYNYTRLDYVYYPLDGQYLNLSFFKRGATRHLDLNQFSVSGGKYFQLIKPLKLYASVQAAASVKLPFKQPFYNSRMFGFGDFYLRGLDLYVVDGVAAGLLRTTLRRQITNWNIPVRFLRSRSIERVPLKLYLKVFGDAGYSYIENPRPSNTLNNRMLYTGGFGIDLMTIYDMGLSFEVGFNQLGRTAYNFK